MTIDTTVKKIDPPGLLEMTAGGAISAMIIFSVGVFLLVVPILGWIIGPCLMVAAGFIVVAHLVGMMMRKPAYVGHCPHCGAETATGGPGFIGECAACKHRFAHRRGQLLELA